MVHAYREQGTDPGVDAPWPRRIQDTSPERSLERPVARVASVPSGHVYCRHIRHPQDRWEVLEDPTDPWWPPLMLDPEWIRSNQFDVMHLHFGFDALAPETLDRAFTALDDLGRSLVYTAHDLRNPHHRSQDLHNEQLEVILSHADRIMTLTLGAAFEISQRFGRTPEIVPHPYVFEPARIRGDRRRQPVVGLHLKSLRANMVEPLAVVEAALEGCEETARLRVDAHTDLVEKHPDLIGHLQRHHERGRLDLHVHDYFDDEAFFDYLSSLTVSILPYRFGTHSGWLEACRDVGTRVVAPSCGYYADQWHDVHSYINDEAAGFDGESLVEALSGALETPLVAPKPEWRAAQRTQIAAIHGWVYAGLTW